MASRFHPLSCVASEIYILQYGKSQGYLEKLSFCPNPALRANILSWEYQTYTCGKIFTRALILNQNPNFAKYPLGLPIYPISSDLPDLTRSTPKLVNQDIYSSSVPDSIDLTHGFIHNHIIHAYNWPSLLAWEVSFSPSSQLQYQLLWNIERGWIVNRYGFPLWLHWYENSWKICPVIAKEHGLFPCSALLAR